MPDRINRERELRTNEAYGRFAPNRSGQAATELHIDDPPDGGATTLPCTACNHQRYFVRVSEWRPAAEATPAGAITEADFQCESCSNPAWVAKGPEAAMRSHAGIPGAPLATSLRCTAGEQSHYFEPTGETERDPVTKNLKSQFRCLGCSTVIWVIDRNNWLPDPDLRIAAGGMPRETSGFVA